MGIRKIHRPHRPQTSYTDHLFFNYFLKLGKYTDLSFKLFFIIGKYTDLYSLTFLKADKHRSFQNFQNSGFGQFWEAYTTYF